MKRRLKAVVRLPTNTDRHDEESNNVKSLISQESELINSELSVSCSSGQPAVAATFTLVFVSLPNYHRSTSITAYSSEQEGKHRALYSKGSFYSPPPLLSQLLTLLRIIN